MKNSRPRKGKGSNSRPTGFSANSHCTTKKLIKAIAAQNFTEAADILECCNVSGDFLLVTLGHLNLILGGGKND
ncbi:MAG: hypothetical protein KME22_06650 [Hassallia sp. WJT32-NPBG1]|jgi:hypothetical protein|nr:hypothetical protein [Hassallia sp. WJT32-NPBG1]